MISRSVGQALRRNGFPGAHATCAAPGLLPGQCFVWFEGGKVPTAAMEFLAGRGYSSLRYSEGLIVEVAVQVQARRLA